MRAWIPYVLLGIHVLCEHESMDPLCFTTDPRFEIQIFEHESMDPLCFTTDPRFETQIFEHESMDPLCFTRDP